MADPKTLPTDASVQDFLGRIEDATRREDALLLASALETWTSERPRMWGPSIVGFGSYHYRYASGREGDWPLAGFSPRKRSLSIYVMAGLERFKGLLATLGKHKVGKSCLYVNHLSDVDLAVLESIVRGSVRLMKKDPK